ncbi:MAG: sulfite exporter TauE/SafE family protein [Lachnospiraceae bacterium]|nr:sulfite exporter TauE/SafE family protein [Lachnospiraceae bacterium]
MFWLWCIAAFAAFYIKGLCGFANTLVFTSILGFGVDNVLISPVDLVLGYPTNLIMTWQYRKHLKIAIWVPLALMVLAGSIPGAILLKSVDARMIKIVFGAAVALIAMEMYGREMGAWEGSDSKVVRIGIGLLSGLLCGLFGVGALLAAYLGRVTERMDEFKANISAVFVVENTFRLVTYGMLGVITIGSLRQTLLLIPVALCGLFAGIYSSKKLDERLIKRSVIVLLMISGVVLVVTNL